MSASRNSRDEGLPDMRSINRKIPISDVAKRLDLRLGGGEVAEVLGCSRALAYKWMAEGVIPTFRVPGSVAIRVPRQALLEWIAAHTQQPRGGNLA